MIEKDISDIIRRQEKVDQYITIIDALCKQLPYTPTPFPGYSGRCKCGAAIMSFRPNYCEDCGQKLNWREKL